VLWEVTVLNLRNDERGLALPLVLTVMVVATLLSSVLWQYSMTDIKQASRKQQKMQAHYIARSGAEAIAQHLIERPQAASQLVASTSQTNPATSQVGSGHFQAFVRHDPANRNVIQIVSNGFNDDVTSQVTLNLLRQQSNIQVFHRAIEQASPHTLDLRGMTVIGDVGSAREIIINPRRFAGTTYPWQTDATYPDAILPSLTTGTVAQQGSDLIVDPNFFYPSIGPHNTGDIVFKTGTPGETVQVVVDTLDAGRNIILQGGGRLELFVTHSATVRTGNKKTVNRPGNESNLVVYLMDGASLTLQANVEFYGYIYGPKATVNVQSGLTTIIGSVIAGSLNRLNGAGGPNGNIIHVPPPSGANILSSVFGYIRGYWSN